MIMHNNVITGPVSAIQLGPTAHQVINLTVSLPLTRWRCFMAAVELYRGVRRCGLSAIEQPQQREVGR